MKTQCGTHEGVPRIYGNKEGSISNKQLKATEFFCLLLISYKHIPLSEKKNK